LFLQVRAAMGVCTQGQMGLAEPPPLEKWIKKKKTENIQKRAFLVLQNALFRSKIFKIFFASGGKGALTP